MNRQLIGSVLGGSVGGAIGTAFIQKSLALSERLPDAVQPPPLEGDPGEYMVERVEERRGRPFGESVHRGAARSLHWLYGIGWGALLGALAPRIGMSSLGRTLAAGAVLGAGVWAVGYAGWLPRTGLAAPLREQGAGHSAGNLAAHVGYGILAAVPIYAALH